MKNEITKGTILVKDGALLPKTVYFDNEPCVPGWRLVNGFDANELDRAIQLAGWNFFTLAGELKATVFGIDREKMICRAIERILANPKSKKFNALEITRVASIGSGRFPLVNYVTVSAQLRHIQSGSFLFRAEGAAKPETNGGDARYLYAEVPVAKPLFWEAKAS